MDDSLASGPLEDAVDVAENVGNPRVGNPIAGQRFGQGRPVHAIADEGEGGTKIAQYLVAQKLI